MIDEFIKYAKSNHLGKCQENVSIKTLTTYKCGGDARCVFTPKNVECLIEGIKFLKGNNITHMVIGNGSNLLFSDNLYDGVLIKLSELDYCKVTRNKITAGAGYSLIKLAYDAYKNSLTGLEFASGIPGTVGGAIYMNAGAYLSDMGYVTESVKVLTPEYQVITMVNKEMEFHYRTSFLKTHPGYICLEATVKLKKGKQEAIKAVMDDRKERRLASQPLEYPSAGSVFRNPEGASAGKLIDDIHLKGLTKGGAQVSNKHANFIINIGYASAKDVMELIVFVHDTVKENYDIDLKCEQEFVNWEKKDGESKEKET